jgi:hypothetical protein
MYTLTATHASLLHVIEVEGHTGEAANRANIPSDVKITYTRWVDDTDLNLPCTLRLLFKGFE